MSDVISNISSLLCFVACIYHYLSHQAHLVLDLYSSMHSQYKLTGDWEREWVIDRQYDKD